MSEVEKHTPTIQVCIDPHVQAMIDYLRNFGCLEDGESFYIDEKFTHVASMLEKLEKDTRSMSDSAIKTRDELNKETNSHQITIARCDEAIKSHVRDTQAHTKEVAGLTEVVEKFVEATNKEMARMISILRRVNDAFMHFGSEPSRVGDEFIPALWNEILDILAKNEKDTLK